jgi:hypothetical protein
VALWEEIERRLGFIVLGLGREAGCDWLGWGSPDW